MTSQSTLFPSAPRKESAKAKALPKLQPAAAPTQPAPLPPALEQRRTANLASVRKARAQSKVGDIQICERPCRRCGGEQIEELSIEPHGGHTWGSMCLTCHPEG